MERRILSRLQLLQFIESLVGRPKTMPLVNAAENVPTNVNDFARAS